LAIDLLHHRPVDKQLLLLRRARPLDRPAQPVRPSAVAHHNAAAQRLNDGTVQFRARRLPTTQMDVLAVIKRRAALPARQSDTFTQLFH